jgi:hypothetical protein
LGSEIVIVSLYGPGCRPEISIETSIESGFPGVTGPPDSFDNLSQLAFFEAVQLRGALPVFLMVKTCLAGSDDPPTVALKGIGEGVSSIFGGTSWTFIFKTRSVGNREVDPELR